MVYYSLDFDSLNLLISKEIDLNNSNQNNKNCLMELLSNQVISSFNEE